MTTSKTISIIIPTFKRRADLLRLLASIADSDYPKKHIEVIIVDNAGDTTEQDVESYAKDLSLKVAHPAENLYCSGGRLYGTKVASGQLFFFIDDDNVLAPDCLRHLVDSFQDDAKLGVAAPLMLFFKDKQKIWSAGANLNKWGLPIYLYGNQYAQDVELPNVIRDITCFPNAFMVRRDVLEAVPFDVDHFPHNWSEADFGLRVKKQGYHTATITKAREWHDIDYGGQTTRTDTAKIYDQAKSRILFRRRFFTDSSHWLMFWGVAFPLSSLYYLKAIWKSPDKRKLAMITRYAKGTLDGVRHPVTLITQEAPIVTND